MGATKDENLLRDYNANDLHYLGLPFDFWKNYPYLFCGYSTNPYDLYILKVYNRSKFILYVLPSYCWVCQFFTLIYISKFT